MRKLIMLTCLVLLGSSLLAQDSLRDFSHEYIGDARIDSILQLHVLQNQKFHMVPGYRIQIFKESGNNALDSALVVRARFSARYNIPVYITFNEPYYRVRVGDFRNQIDAIRFLMHIKRWYPLAWEIKGEINFPK